MPGKIPFGVILTANTMLRALSSLAVVGDVFRD